MKNFNQFICEIFDKPWEYVQDPLMTDKIKNAIHMLKGSNERFTNVHAYEIEGNNGYLITFVRNGMLEVHHMDEDENSGIIVDKFDKPSPRFYSTMIDVIKSKALDKSRPARIVAAIDSPMMKYYQSMVTKLSKKYKYRFKSEFETTLGTKRYVITLYPIGYTHGVTELFTYEY